MWGLDLVRCKRQRQSGVGVFGSDLFDPPSVIGVIVDLLAIAASSNHSNASSMSMLATKH